MGSSMPRRLGNRVDGQRPEGDVEVRHAHRDGGVGDDRQPRRGGAVQQPGRTARVVDRDDDARGRKRPTVREVDGAHPSSCSTAATGRPRRSRRHADGRRRSVRRRGSSTRRAGTARRAPRRAAATWPPQRRGGRGRPRRWRSAGPRRAPARPASSSVTWSIHADAGWPAHSAASLAPSPPRARATRRRSPTLRRRCRVAGISSPPARTPARSRRGAPPADRHAEALQDVEPARRAVQRVRSQVEVVPQAVAGASPAAEVLGAFDQDHGPAGPGEGRGGGEPGEPPADDDGAIGVHDRETIDAGRA